MSQSHDKQYSYFYLKNYYIHEDWNQEFCTDDALIYYMNYYLYGKNCFIYDNNNKLTRVPPGKDWKLKDSNSITFSVKKFWSSEHVKASMSTSWFA